MEAPDQTVELLQRWHGGDAAALHALIERDAGWVHGAVRRRMGEHLRHKLESIDVVQEAMGEVLRYVPRFVVPDRTRFRALMARIVENVLRDQHQFFHARRRAMSREQAPGTALSLDGLGGSFGEPGAVAEANEEERWVHMALELLEPDVRDVLVLRLWEELPFDAIGERLGLTESGARMKFQRALPKLADKVKALRQGTWLEQQLDLGGD